METRLQHILLKKLPAAALACCMAFSSVSNAADDKQKLRVNSELFDIGVSTGIINIEDFPSEFVIGANITFKASEDFFLQYNYYQADVSESSFEKNDASVPFDLEDRKFKHFDLLLGYNLFQGEFFASEGKGHLSNLYIVGGIGDTEIGGEDNFTYTLGIGYQIEFFRRYLVRFDYRDYFYESSLVVGGEEDTVHNNQITTGIGYLF